MMSFYQRFWHLCYLILCGIFSINAYGESRHIAIELFNHQGESSARANSPLVSHTIENYISDATPRYSHHLTQPKEQLLVVALNTDGEKISERVIDNPLVTRVEVFNPDTGSIEQRAFIERESGVVNFTLPQSNDIAQLKIYEMQNNGLIEIDRITVGEPTASRGKRSAIKTENTQVKQVLYNGDPDNRSDLVLVAEGYTARELANFKNDVDRILAGYFDVRPYRQYKNFFNAWRIDVPSNVSGAGTNDRRIGTPFGARFGCFGIQRLLCVDERTVESYVRERMPDNQVDQILVVVNTATYGGAGGRVATMSLAPAAIDLALHEVGHSYGRLADEYDYGNCDLREPRETNVTTNYGAKWGHWVGVDNIGWFEGANYCESGVYRPTNNSMMRTLGRPFFAVNNEALVLKTYEYVDSIDAVSPNRRSVTINGSETFRVDTVKPIPNTLNTTWLVDNRQVATGDNFTMQASDYRQGSYRLTASVKDTTAMVRKDDDNLTIDSFSWAVTINDGTACTRPARVEKPIASNITSTAFTIGWNAVNAASSYLIQTWDGSEWQDYDTANGESIVMRGFSAESTQYVQVTAINACGDLAEPSSWLEVKLESNPCIAAGVPGKPTANSITQSQFTAQWAAANNADSYQVQLWIEGAWSDYDISNTNSLQVSGINRSNAYVRAIGINACGTQGVPSSWTEVTMRLCSAAPTTPNNLRIDGSQVVWSSSEGAIQYDIFQWDGSEWIAYTSTSNTALNIRSDTPQYVSVRAANSCGSSRLSNWISTR